MDVTSIVGGTAALTAGLASSLHCSVMCGPLACAGLSGQDRRWSSAAGYHVGRITAYAFVGALFGVAGSGVAAVLAEKVTPWLPWVMAAGLLATVFNVGRHLGAIPGLGGVSAKVMRLGSRLSPSYRTLVLGAVTPLLPCGLLYGLMIAAAASAHPVSGALVMGAFAVGSTPALILAQLQTRWLRSPSLGWVRRVIPAVAALVIIWRAVSVGPPVAPPLASAEPEANLPSMRQCH